MNMKNVQNGQELDIVPNIQPSCFSIVESLVGPVDSNHVSVIQITYFLDLPDWRDWQDPQITM